MATRAEQFRSETQRSAQKVKPKAVRKKAPSKKQLAVEAMDEKRSGPHTAERNFSLRAARKSSTALEDSTEYPSRRSTRKASNRGRASAQLERRQKRATHSPETRSARAQTRTVKVRGHSKAAK